MSDVRDDAEHLNTAFQSYIYKSKYSRYLWEERRRETWPESVERYFAFFDDHLRVTHGYEVDASLRKRLKDAVINLEVMPSMRALMTAGPALERDHMAGFNCSFLVIDRPQAFDEVLYLLACGTGVGFSVERQFVNQLPVVAEDFHASDTVINVRDSKIGWAQALRELIAMLYHGQVPKWDLSKVRPKGSPLKTFGGRASGPEPLDTLLKFAVDLFKRAAGRKLNSLECHDLVCMIADSVVSGGVRRSALISLSNLSDDRMRSAKSGQWWEKYGHRRLANNSAAYTEKPEMGIFMDEWKALYDSKSGERGIFNRQAAQKHVSLLDPPRDPNHDFGVNPCGEVLLRPSGGLCNLTEVVLRADDTEKSIEKKLIAATVLGTWQSTLTNFRYVSKRWKKNAEEERLLGVSLTGIMDCPLTNLKDGDKGALIKRLKKWNGVVKQVNAEVSAELGINQSVARTCVKPSGTVSSLVLSGPGIHEWHSQYYIRRVREDATSPVAQLMIDQGVPHEEDVMKPGTWVFSFPMKAPDGAVLKDQRSAIEQLETWKIYRNFWTDHNPSITVTVREDEWMKVGAWVYENFDDMTGVSFLPHSDHTYKQAPYEEITREEYERALAAMPVLDWTQLPKYETTDMTTGSQELACGPSANGTMSCAI